MTFEIEVGHASRNGPRETNEDFAGATRSAPGDAVPGLIAAIADGVSSGGRGREAAQTSVMGLLADFFATPATWETSVALDRLIGAQNAWLVAQNRQRGGRGGELALTTLSALVLQGQRWTLAHVGDTRIWRVAGGEIQQLTLDHAFSQPDLRNRLTRAVGLDELLHVDSLHGELQLGDCFVLSSDGVHGVLKPRQIGTLAGQGSAAQAAEAIVEAALAAGTRDNASALVVRVRGLDAARLEDEAARLRHLAPLPPLRVGDAVDGYTITALVADTGVHRLYQARDARTQQLVALKTLHESRAVDAEERAMLAHETWLSQRVTERDARGFVRSHPVHEASALYTVFDWHGGQTLEQILSRQPRGAPAEVVAAAMAMARALGRLHRQGVIHRDIKPGNLHRGDDGQWRVLDLGVALSGREGVAQRELHAGTPSYINPEQWAGEPADAGSDLFALGVTLYRWLAGRLPYGEIEPYQGARYRRDPVPLSRIRPDVPIWLDHLVLRAIAIDPKQRFETAEEMLLALERGAARPVSAPAATPLAARDPTALWKIALGISLLFNALLVFWLVFLPH
ncbi:MAG: bifunctional protein-serine/threonine kinase/phosphatase [Piscinibacter sp.]|uniref:bifunctional protein-serine/threonine kinase/phosphatase n=1 Tax=Piscinibacter sp. TaxID=1903157 RepID=UPI00258A88D9|nr:bifunctional protein-serine/threonine kinase/phosphatase [Piscinibacter sp.]MCW5663452.1 bifunctional protein-serine/threonine kinase/phosphatase [Piscinibacter sp.]